MRTIRLALEYDGTDFSGWQRQRNARSVQQVLEEAFSVVTGERVSVVGAGRTDAGVHARGQVAHFRTKAAIAPAAIAHSLNGVLPHDVVIRHAEEAANDFSARNSAVQRHYRYFIMRRPTALERRYVWQLFYPLDLALMERTAARFLTVKDFSSFAKSESGVEDNCCDVAESRWYEDEGGRLVYSIRADRFLRGMVRALVGTMVDIGRGHVAFEELESIIASHDRSKAGPSAPAQGLFLEEVRY